MMCFSPKIVVVMSSYNGANVLERQLDSIFTQKDVDVCVYVRDDGSSDATINVLTNYKNNKQKDKLIVEIGDNVGWQRSFLLALKNAPEADYYAFSDQDDFWFENKLINGINHIQSRVENGPILFHCNKISTDEKLTPLKKQVKRIPAALNRQNAIVQEYVQGCSIVMNRSAKELVTRITPQNKIPHDFWCALVCFLFGKIIYDDKPYFYHITYGTNASGEGFLWKSRLQRLKKFFAKGNVYYIPITEILETYSDLLTEKDKIFLSKLRDYKKSFDDKLFLLFSPKFRRASIVGTLSLKLSIIFNKL